MLLLLMGRIHRANARNVARVPDENVLILTVRYRAQLYFGLSPPGGRSRNGG